MTTTATAKLLPRFIRATKVAKLTGLPIDHLRAMADRGTFARRHLTTGENGQQQDFFRIDEVLDWLPKLPGDPKALAASREFADWQAAGRRVGRRRPAGQSRQRGSTASSQ